MLILPLAAWLLRGPLLAPLVLAKIEAILGEVLGGKVRLEGLSGSWLGSLGLSRAGTEGAATATPIQGFVLEGLHARYSLLDLLRGRPDWLESVSIDRVHAELDLQAGATAAEPAAAPEPLFVLLEDLLASLPLVEVAEWSLVLKDGDVRVTAPLGRLTLSAARQLVLEASGARLEAPDADFEGLGLQVRTTLASGALPWSAELALSQGRLVAKGTFDPESQVLQADVQAFDLDPAPLARFAGEDFTGRLDLEVQGEISLLDPAAAVVQLDATARALRWRELDVATLHARGALRPGAWELAAFQMEGPGLSVQLENVLAQPLADQDPVQWLRGVAALGSVRVDDVADLARRAGFADLLPAGGPHLQSFEIAADLAAGRLRLPRAEFVAQEGSLRLKDAVAELPDGAGLSGALLHLPIDVAVTQPEGVPGLATLPPFQANLVAGIAPLAGAGDARARVLSLTSFELRTADDHLVLENPVELIAEPGRIRIDDLNLDGGKARLVARGSLPLDLFGGDALADGALELEVRLPRVDLAALAPLLPADLPLPRSGSAALALSLQGPWEAPRIALDLSGDGLTIGGGELELPEGPWELAVSAQYQDGEFVLRPSTVRGPGLTTALEGALALPVDLRAIAAGRAPSTDGPLRGGVQLVVADLADLAPYAQVLENFEGLAGSGEFRVQVEGTLANPAASGTLALRDLRYEERPPLQVDLQASHAGALLTLSKFEVRGPRMQLHASGFLPFDPRGPELLPDEPLQVQAVLAEVDAAALHAWLPEAWRETFSAGRIALNLQVAGRRSSPQGTLAFHGRGLVPAAAVHRTPLDLELRATLDDRRLAFPEVRFGAGRMRAAIQGGVPLALRDDDPLGPGPLDLGLRIEEFEIAALTDFLPEGVEVPLTSGRMQGTLTLGGDWNDPTFDVRLTGQDVRPVAGSVPLPEGVFEVALGAGYRQGTVSIGALSVRSPALTIGGSGTWRFAFAPHALLAGTPPALDGAVAGKLALTVPKLDWLAGSYGLRRIAGRLTAEVDFGGTVADLRPSGRIALQRGELRLDNPSVAPLSRLDLRAAIDAEGLRLESFTGELGAAPFTASGNVVFAGDQGPALDLKLRGTDLLLFRQDGVKVRVDTDLRVHGPLSQLLAEGKLDVTDGRMVKNFDLLTLSTSAPSGPSGPGGLQLFSLEPPLDKLRFAIEVSSKSGFRIKNNVLDGLMRPQLRLEGTGEVPLLRGAIYVDQVRVALPATTVVVDSGVVRFLERDPFVPRLDVFASVNKYGYAVSMIVTGPYNEPTVTLSSVPPLPQDELLMLVTTGQPPSQGLDSAQALGSVAIYLARDLVRSLTSDESTEATDSILERLEIETGRDTSRQGEETIQGRFLLLRNVLVEGDALLLEGEKDGYSDFNMGLKIRFRFR